MKLNFEEFREELIETLKEHEEYHFKKVTFPKTNHNYQGIGISQAGECVAMCIPLESEYCQYRTGNESVHNISEKIWNMVQDNGFEEMAMKDIGKFLGDYKNVRERIFCRLINKDLNRDKMEKMPYIEYYNMLVIFYVKLEGAICNITNAMLCQWGIDEEMLKEISMENMITKCVVKCTPLEDILPECYREESVSNMMFVIRMGEDDAPEEYGSSILLFPDLLKKVLEQYEISEQCIIIPSSVYEILVINTDETEGINEMISNINKAELEIEDVLSDKGFLFNRKKCELEIL